MTYIVVRQQAGEGCDYTIGCGIQYDYVKADSDEEALAKVEALYKGPDGNGDDGYYQEGVKTVLICRLVSDLHNTVAKWHEEVEEIRGEFDRERQREKDIEQLKIIQARLRGGK